MHCEIRFCFNDFLNEGKNTTFWAKKWEHFTLMSRNSRKQNCKLKKRQNYKLFACQMITKLNLRHQQIAIAKYWSYFFSLSLYPYPFHVRRQIIQWLERCAYHGQYRYGNNDWNSYNIGIVLHCMWKMSKTSWILCHCIIQTSRLRIIKLPNTESWLSTINHHNT